MINPTTMSEQLMFTTTQINALTPAGLSRGSGFFYIHELPDTDDKVMVFIITNKHVVKNAVGGLLRFHTAKDGKPSGEMVELPFDDGFEDIWFKHPNEDIDLCAFPISHYINMLNSAGIDIFYRAVSRNSIPNQAALEDLSAIEDVAMIGYPIGLIDHVNNLPIAKKGITANHPAIDFQGAPVGLIDIACFRGSSGSPIFVLNEGMYATRQGTNLGSRALFLGVQYAGAIERTDGSIEERPLPTTTQQVAVTDIMVNLAYYVKARELIVLVDGIVDGSVVAPAQQRLLASQLEPPQT